MKRNSLTLLFLFVVAASSVLPQDKPEPVYQDPSAPIQDRVRDLLSHMTLEEKVAQLESGCNYPNLPGASTPSLFVKDQLDEALVKKTLANGVGTYSFLDEFTSLLDGPLPARTGAHRRNLLQHWVISNTRLGIPIM
jgi:beta-glucosidase